MNFLQNVEDDELRSTFRIYQERYEELDGLIHRFTVESQQRSNSMKEYMQSLAKFCAPLRVFDVLLGLPREANFSLRVLKRVICEKIPIVGDALATFLESCDEFTECHEVALDIVKDIDVSRLFITISRERLESDVIPMAIGNILDLFVTIMKTILKLSSNVTLGALLANHEHVEELNKHKKALSRQKDLLDWYIKTEVWCRALGIEQNAGSLVLDKLCPVRDAYYEMNTKNQNQTRLELLRSIKVWSETASGPKIFWLHGFAGSGKTTIAHTVAKVLDDEKHLAGCFFCTRDSKERSNPKRVIPTITYQLSTWHRAYRSLIVDLLNGCSEPKLHTGLEEQYEMLIKKPLQQLSRDMLLSDRSLVFVFDALDECCGSGISQYYLSMYLAKIASAVPQLKVFISSMKKPEIEDGLRCNVLEACDMGDPRDVLQDDIRVYMTYLDGSRNENGIRQRYIESLFLKIHGELGLVDGGMKAYEWCLEIMRSQLRFNVCNLESAHLKNEEVPDLGSRISGHLSATLHYACLHWMEHVMHSDDAHRSATTVLKFLRSIGMLYWLEVLSLTGTLEYGKAILGKCIEHFEDNTNIVQAATEWRTFTSECYETISICTPHVYIFALSWGVSTFSEPSPGQGLTQGLGVLQSRLDILADGLRHAQCIALSRNGSKLAAGYQDGGLRIWNAVNSELIRRINAHDRRINDVQFSPDGKRFVTASADKTLRIWDTQSGDLVRSLRGHTDYVQAVTYSPLGTRIVSASWDKTVRIWDVQSGASIGKPLGDHEGSVIAVIFSPDVRKIASCSYDKTVRLWGAFDGNQIEQLYRKHKNAVRCVSFSPDGRNIVSVSYYDTMRVWDIRTGEDVVQPRNCCDNSSVAYTPDGRRIVSGSANKTLHIWDAISLDPICVIRPGECLWDPDDGRFLSYPAWWPDDLAPTAQTLIHSNAPTQIPDDGWLRTLDGGLFLWVPPKYREDICCRGPMGKIPPRVRFDWKKVPHGKDWTRVKDMIEGKIKQSKAQ